MKISTPSRRKFMTSLGIAAVGAVAAKSFTVSKIGSPTPMTLRESVLARIRHAQAKGLQTCSIEFAEQELSKGYKTAGEYIKAKYGQNLTADKLARVRKSLLRSRSRSKAMLGQATKAGS